MNTNLSTVISASAGRDARLDKTIKELLSDIQVLARIVKYTVTEVEHLSIEEIMVCIDSNSIETDSVPIDPGMTNFPKVESKQVENSIQGEGFTFFDIRFSLYYKEKELKVIINLEAQKTMDKGTLGYHLENRIVFYLSRLISSQKQVEFFNSDYDDIKKVYSIWICMDAKSDEDAISRISLKAESVYGKPMEFPKLDKLCGVVIRIRERKDLELSKNKLIAMLEDLISKQEGKKKKELLEERYGMVMTQELGRRVDDMCNLSEVIIKNAVLEGMEQGRAEGMEQGRAEGRTEGIISMIKSLKALNIADNLILQQLQLQFSLTEEKANEYLSKC